MHNLAIYVSKNINASISFFIFMISWNFLGCVQGNFPEMFGLCCTLVIILMVQSKARLARRRALAKQTSKVTQNVWDIMAVNRWMKQKGPKYRSIYRRHKRMKRDGDYPLISSLIRYHFARNYRPGGPCSEEFSK